MAFINGDVHVTGGMTIGGSNNINAMTATTTAKTSDVTVNSGNHDDIAQLSGLSFSPAPDGSTSYMISALLNTTAVGNTGATLRLWVGSNGGQADITAKLVLLKQTNSNEGIFGFTDFIVTPSSSDTKYGLSFLPATQNATIKGGSPVESYITVVRL
jgi:hypothetical protein